MFHHDVPELRHEMFREEDCTAIFFVADGASIQSQKHSDLTGVDSSGVRKPPHGDKLMKEYSNVEQDPGIRARRHGWPVD